MHRRIRRELAVLCALFLFLAATSFAEPVPPSVAEKIDSLFTDVARSDAPGVAVAAIRDGEIVYRNAFGVADLERRVALTPDSVFEIGSAAGRR